MLVAPGLAVWLASTASALGFWSGMGGGAREEDCPGRRLSPGKTAVPTRVSGKMTDSRTPNLVRIAGPHLSSGRGYVAGLRHGVTSWSTRRILGNGKKLMPRN